jgi:hypothetical protein
MELTAKGISLLTALLVAAPVPGDQLVEPSSEQRFDRNPVVDGKQFVCLGAAVRRRAFFQVYALDFCIEEAAGRAELARYLAGFGRRHLSKPELSRSLEDDPEFFRHVMTMPVEKLTELVFVRDVSAQKLRDAFAWSLTQALGESEKPRIDAFVGMIDRDIKEGDRLSMRTKPSGEVSLSLNAEHEVRDEKLARALWTTYLGPESVTPRLKASVAMGVASLNLLERRSSSK